jgi:succinyl-diaminopimelate desuccinylase
MEPVGQPVPLGARRAGGRRARRGGGGDRGVRRRSSTSGGTSDGRFLASIAAEVVDFGPVGASIHAIDEHVRVADVAPLSMIYERAIEQLLERG